MYIFYNVMRKQNKTTSDTVLSGYLWLMMYSIKYHIKYTQVCSAPSSFILLYILQDGAGAAGDRRGS